MWKVKMSLNSTFSASTWSNVKSKDSLEILRPSRFQNWPYFWNLVKIWGSYCQKTKKRNSKIHPLLSQFLIGEHPVDCCGRVDNQGNKFAKCGSVQFINPSYRKHNQISQNESQNCNQTSSYWNMVLKLNLSLIQINNHGLLLSKGALK